MIAFAICSHAVQLTGNDRGELGIVFSDQVVALEDLLKENLKNNKLQEYIMRLFILPILNFIKPIYDCEDLFGKPKIFVIQEKFRML